MAKEILYGAKKQIFGRCEKEGFVQVVFGRISKGKKQLV
jgi:hypothetical protein